MDFGARVVIQDSARGQRSGRRTDDLYDERSICTTNGSHRPTRSLEDYGSEASHVTLVPGESGTVVDRRRARKAAQAASTSTMEAACDQSRRPRCWPLGRGALPVRGCSASASGYLQRRWRRRSTLPTLLWNERARLDTAPLPPQPDSRRSSRLFLKRFVAWAVAFAGGCVVGGVSVMSRVVTIVGPFQAAMVAIWWR